MNPFEMEFAHPREQREGQTGNHRSESISAALLRFSRIDRIPRSITGHTLGRLVT
jgi:hypothetical protein